MGPPAPRPNAATPCSRPPSRHCAGSVSAPGASAPSPPPPSSCCTTSTAAAHDQQGRKAATGNGSLIVRDNERVPLSNWVAIHEGRDCRGSDDDAGLGPVPGDATEDAFLFGGSGFLCWT